MLFLLVALLAASVSAGVRTPTRRPAPRVSPVPRPATSALSRSVVAQMTPDLQREFSEAGLTWAGPLYLRAFKYTTSKVAEHLTRLSGLKGPQAQRDARGRFLNHQYITGSSIEVWAKRTDSEVYELFKSYPVCVYSGKIGPKQKEGDGTTPEGFYEVVPSAFNPNSAYRLSFNVGYPNKYDKLKRRTGGAVMVHGHCASIGCFAMNELIDEIYTVVSASADKGQIRIPFHIFPFPMVEKSIKNASYIFPDNAAFWNDELRPPYEQFESAANKIPPTVIVDTSAGAPLYKLFQ